MKIPENELFEIAMPAGVLGDDVMGKVMDILDYDKADFLRDLLEEDHESWTAWMANKGKFAGTWPKRFSKAWFKETGENLPASEMAKVGEYLGKFAKASKDTHFFEFRKTAFWKAGSFGEYTYSCWWEGNGWRERLIDANGGAILFYKNKRDYKAHAGKQGIGRCWIIPDGKYHVIFNAYGPTDLRIIAHVLSMALGCSYSRINADSDVHINDEHSYAIGKTKDLPAYNDYVELDL